MASEQKLPSMSNPAAEEKQSTGLQSAVVGMAKSESSGEGQTTEFNAQDELRVLRKIDRVVLPLMCFIYFFQYLDKQSIGYAAAFGLQKDLQMTGNQYSWTISLFYFGSFVAEYPFIYLMSRLPVVKFVAVSIILWGVLEMCLAFPQSFSGFGAVRFLLGFAEGAVSPAFVIITGLWYKRSENPFRVATWVSCNGLAQIIGALLMYAIGGAGKMALENWRVMFLIAGGGTVTCGTLFFFLMPAEPSKAWFLSSNDKEIARLRLAYDRASRDRAAFSKPQLVEALTDITTYFYFLFGLLVTMPSPVIKFASLIIEGFGYSAYQTMLVGLPAGAIQILFIWIAVIGIRVTKNSRTWWAIGVTVVPLVGNIAILTLPANSGWAIVANTWLATVISPVLTVILSMMASNVKGNTKKSTVSLVFFLAYSVGCIASPQLWNTDQAPRYKNGIITDIVSFVLLIICLLAYRFILARENRKRDIDEGSFEVDALEILDTDLTDREDKGFRYTL